MRLHPGGGADLKLEHRALLVELFRSPAQFLAEEFAQFTGDKTVINTQGTKLGTATAESTSIAQLVQPGYGGPVELNISPTELCLQLAAGLYIFIDQTPEDFRAISGTIEVILAAGEVNRTGITACLTLGAIIYGKK